VVFGWKGEAGSTKRISRSNRSYQSADTQNAHYPFHVVGQDVYPGEPLISYQINRQLSGWNLPPLVIRAFGARCQKATCAHGYELKTADNGSPLFRPCMRQFEDLLLVGDRFFRTWRLG
jgi:hypothetical protein